MVLSIECERNSSSRWDDPSSDRIQKGDIVEELQIGSTGESLKAPFKMGRSGVQKILRSSYRHQNQSILVRVKRYSATFLELQAEVFLPSSSRKEQYALRSISDRSFVFSLLERTESDCLDLQGYNTASLMLQDEFKTYPWERRMCELLAVSNSSCFFSLLLFPKAVATGYNDLEDTLARANTWLLASQAGGVPINFVNLQTEPMLTKISGGSASPTVNAGPVSVSELSNVSLYGFEDYHGVDLGVMRTVRLWFSPAGAEIPVELKFKERDERLGFSLERSEEGFIYIKSVEHEDSLPSTRSKLSSLYKEAQRASKLLVVSRVSNEKVLPWMIASLGTIRCFDVSTLKDRLYMQRDAKETIRLHVFSSTPSTSAEFSSLLRPFSPTSRSSGLRGRPFRQHNQDVDTGNSTGESSFERNDNSSFSFHSLSLPDDLP